MPAREGRDAVAAVKERAAGRWPELLEEVGGIPGDFLSGKHTPCPRCGGKDRFRLVDAEAGAVLCSQCFNEKNGDGISAIQWHRGWDFAETLERLADHLGVEVRRSKNGAVKTKPLQPFEPGPWVEALAAVWATSKKPISLDAVERVGGRLGTWHGHGESHKVVGIPIRRRPGGSVTGWACYNVAPKGTLPTSSGRVKIVSTRGAKAGWLGDLDAIANAGVVWKVEGVSDMLALASAIPTVARSGHAVITNAFGAGEKPKAELLEILTGKTVVVVADNDEPGQAGGDKWSREVARVAGDCRLLVVPGPGKDLRDWLLAGGDFRKLRDLARDLEPVPSPGARNDGDDLMDDACPMRLAKVFLRRFDNLIRTWREDSYIWEHGRWVRISRADLRQLVTLAIEEEFRRLTTERRAEKRDAEPAVMPKITRSLVESALGNAAALSGVSSRTEWLREIDQGEDGVWRELPGKPRRLVAFRNGLLDLRKAIAGDEDAFDELRPDWWSPQILPYDYDPAAQIGPCFARFLEQNLEGDPDLVGLLQQWAGYLLEPTTDQQKCLVLGGEGSNGKSVYQAILTAMLGAENVSSVGLEKLGSRFQLSPLEGKLANMVPEVGSLDSEAEHTFRAIVSGQPVMVEKKGREPYSVELPTRFTIAWNNPPRFRDSTNATWRRMILVNLSYVVPDEEKIEGMDKAQWWADQEGELAGIFNWALMGLAWLRSEGRFTIPGSVQANVDALKEESNPAQSFLESHYEEASEGWSVDTTDVYKAYREWCIENGYSPKSSAALGRDVKRVFPRSEKDRLRKEGIRYYRYRGVRALERRGFIPDGVDESIAEGL